MKFNGKEVDIRTVMVRGTKGWDPVTGSISFPIYQSATFRHPSLEVTTGYDYSRQGNPTRQELEETLATLEGGSDALAFSTGMAAVSTVMDLLKSGDHIIISEDLYGGVYRFAEELLSRRGIGVDYIDPVSPQRLEQFVRPSTRLVWIETPTNPLMRITDIAAVAEWCRKRGILSLVDNTFLSPYLQRPLGLGADIVLHSGTKYLGGHNDTLAGFLVVSDKVLADRLRLIHKTTGGVLGPFESWLMLRGLKTLSIRLEREQENAQSIVEFLKSHKKVSAVYYPGLKDHPGHEIHKRQASGSGAMISFRVREPELVPQVLKRVRVVTFAESLGGVESLITFPMTQTHAAIPEEIRKRIGVDETLLRLSVGIEAAVDLIDDLREALE